MARSDFSGLVKNPKMKLVLSDCGHLDSSTLGKNYTLLDSRVVGKAAYKHCCTAGPSTWYRKAGINLTFWNGKGPHRAGVEDMKASLQRAGMVAVWHGTGQEANSKLTSSKYLRPGDVASMISSNSGHGVMWTGEDWRSDCIQGTRPYPYTAAGRGGNWTFILWRHPDLQEAGLPIQGDGLGNAMGEGESGFSGSSHEWPDFNLKDFPIMTDEKGKYTNEPILLGIANHLQINGIGGVGGAVGDVSDGAFSGQCPFTLDQFLNIDCSKFQKYAAGGYLHGDHLRKAIKGRTFSTNDIPADFLEKAKAYSSSSGCPLSVLIIFGRSESRFTDHVPNSYGYGGYFGTHPKYGGGYGKPFDVQASFVLKSWNNAKKYSPGASGVETLVIAAISHQLPSVASKWWSQTNGKIWSLDADWLATNIKACRPSISAVTLAEALEVNVVGQYYGCQAANGKIVI